jgi:DNA-binding transcriptional ArsR family regulator
MAIAIVMVLALVAITSPKTSPVNPAALTLLTGRSSESIECRPAAGPDTVLDESAPNRAKTFSLVGSYECRRSVFTNEERDAFVERLLQAESSKAKRIASSLAERLREKNIVEPLGLVVTGLDDSELQRALAAVYRVELTSTLGAGRLSRLEGLDPLSSTSQPYIEIEARRVDAPELMTKVQLVTRARNGERAWQEL